jgi:hypothetical protein
VNLLLLESPKDERQQRDDAGAMDSTIAQGRAALAS